MTTPPPLPLETAGWIGWTGPKLLDGCVGTDSVFPGRRCVTASLSVMTGVTRPGEITRAATVSQRPRATVSPGSEISTSRVREKSLSVLRPVGRRLETRTSAGAVKELISGGVTTAGASVWSRSGTGGRTAVTGRTRWSRSHSAGSTSSSSQPPSSWWGSSSLSAAGSTAPAGGSPATAVFRLRQSPGAQSSLTGGTTVRAPSWPGRRSTT